MTKASTRETTVVFLHLCVERMCGRVGCDFSVAGIADPGTRKARHALISPGTTDPPTVHQYVRFSPISESTMRLIVLAISLARRICLAWA